MACWASGGSVCKSSLPRASDGRPPCAWVARAWRRFGAGGVHPPRLISPPSSVDGPTRGVNPFCARQPRRVEKSGTAVPLPNHAMRAVSAVGKPVRLRHQLLGGTELFPSEARTAEMTVGGGGAVAGLAQLQMVDHRSR